MGDVAAVQGVRRQVRELVDGTLEVRVHVAPINKQDFLKLFPEIDTAVALAPLTPQAALSAARADEEAARKVAEQRRRESAGTHRADQRLSQYAAMLCREPMFQAWCQYALPALWMQAVKDAAKNPKAATPEELAGAAAITMRDRLNISSRAELDGDDDALIANFRREIREPYAAWVAQQEGRA